MKARVRQSLAVAAFSWVVLVSASVLAATPGQVAEPVETHILADDVQGHTSLAAILGLVWYLRGIERRLRDLETRNAP